MGRLKVGAEIIYTLFVDQLEVATHKSKMKEAQIKIIDQCVIILRSNVMFLS